jgi:hypothetical protein
MDNGSCGNRILVGRMDAWSDTCSDSGIDGIFPPREGPRELIRDYREKPSSSPQRNLVKVNPPFNLAGNIKAV